MHKLARSSTDTRRCPSRRAARLTPLAAALLAAAFGGLGTLAAPAPAAAQAPRPTAAPAPRSAASAASAASRPAPSRPAPQYAPALFSGMRYRLVGPFRAGRSVTATGVVGQPDHFYFGAVAGGVWESNDAGLTWHPIFDHEHIASIGAVAVSRSNPTTIYVGTGEADMRTNISYGNGVYKSTDGGRTWQHLGLVNTRRIGRIIIDPKNPNRVFVAALGHAYGPNPERGIYRTTDGGQTWKKVLFHDVNTGAIDLAFDPSNANTIYAVLWGTRRPPWNVYPPSNGYGAVYKSTDGGDTWHQLKGGLPGGPGVGRIGIAVAPSSPQRVYAQVDADSAHGGIYRSDDGGRTWQRLDHAMRIWGRGWYFGSVTVDPKNADVVYVMNTTVYRSTDGGRTFDGFKGAPGGDDYHQLWIDPHNDQHMILASDQGVIVSVNGGASWSSWNNQPTGQFYHVVADHRFPYWIYGSEQDSGARKVLSRSNGSGGINFRYWGNACAGGESGYIAIDPLNENILYGDSYDGSVTRCNQAEGTRKSISPTLAYPDSAYQSMWTMPLVASQADPHAIYFGNQYLYKTTDRGQSWHIISPVLTRKNPGAPSNLDAAAAHDLTALERSHAHWGVIYTIAPSPLQPDMVWAGTDDGLIWVTRDGGKSWDNVTPPALTPWSRVSMMVASYDDPAEAYAAIDRHQLDDFNPHIYRTRDGGKTWTEIDSGIPDGAYLHAIREDPVRRGLLFAGTELGVYVSFDDGDHWQPLQLNLPVTSIRDFAIRDNDLVVATHGRAFWVLDDIAPLRQLSARVAQSSAYLFQPDTAIQIRRRSRGAPTAGNAPYVDPLQRYAGQNPPDGAVIDYYLESAATDSVTLEILDAQGRPVRRYASTAKPHTPNPKTMVVPAGWIQKPKVLSAAAGMHRWVWDLHYQGGAGAASFAGAPGAWVLPGQYTVKLSVDGRSFTRPLTVTLDPRVHPAPGALQAQLAMAKQIATATRRADRAMRQIRALRARLDSLESKAGHRGSLLRDMRKVDARALDILGSQPPANPDASGVGDGAPAPSSLLYLRGHLGAIQRSAEGGVTPPTAESKVGFQKLSHTLDATLERWTKMQHSSLPKLNKELKRAGLAPVALGAGL